jgi:hypothetical protein
MNDATPQELGILAKLVLLLAVVLIVAGVVWHGVTATLGDGSGTTWLNGRMSR